MDALSETCKNELDPTDKTGAMSNVFGVQINFPPSTEEKKEISKINNSESLYSKDYIVPHVKVGEKCECGFYYETMFFFIPKLVHLFKTTLRIKCRLSN